MKDVFANIDTALFQITLISDTFQIGFRLRTVWCCTPSTIYVFFLTVEYALVYGNYLKHIWTSNKIQLRSYTNCLHIFWFIK